MAMKWPMFVGSALVVLALLLVYGAPVKPVIAGIVLFGLWKFLVQDRRRRA